MKWSIFSGFFKNYSGQRSTMHGPGCWSWELGIWGWDFWRMFLQSTLQGTNISHQKSLLKMIFLFEKVGYFNSLEGRWISVNKNEAWKQSFSVPFVKSKSLTTWRIGRWMSCDKDISRLFVRVFTREVTSRGDTWVKCIMLCFINSCMCMYMFTLCLNLITLYKQNIKHETCILYICIRIVTYLPMFCIPFAAVSLHNIAMFFFKTWMFDWMRMPQLMPLKRQNDNMMIHDVFWWQ